MIDFNLQPLEEIANTLNTVEDIASILSEQELTEIIRNPEIFNLIDQRIGSELTGRLARIANIAELISEGELQNLLSLENIGDILGPEAINTLLAAFPQDIVNNVLSTLENVQNLLSFAENFLEDPLEVLKETLFNEVIGPIAGSLLNNELFTNLVALSEVFEDVFGSQAFSQELNEMVSFLNTRGLGFLINNTDLGVGNYAASGSPSGTASGMSPYGRVRAAGASDPGVTSGTNGGNGYTSLSTVLDGVSGQNWTATNNPESPNELIIEAYRVSGRNYERDGVANEYNWNAAFVNWVLSSAGLEYIQSMSPMAYRTYGTPVDISDFRDVRLNDLIIFDSASPIGLIGFVRAYDPVQRVVTVLAGNIGGTVRETELPFSRTDPVLRVTHIRRNWSIPADANVPLYPVTSRSFGSFNANGTVRGPGQNARPNGVNTPIQAPDRSFGNFTSNGTIRGSGQAARPNGSGLQTTAPTRSFGTFNANGTISGPGQAARGGARPRVETRAERVDRLSGGSGASSGGSLI